MAAYETFKPQAGAPRPSPASVATALVVSISRAIHCHGRNKLISLIIRVIWHDRLILKSMHRMERQIMVSLFMRGMHVFYSLSREFICATAMCRSYSLISNTAEQLVSKIFLLLFLLFSFVHRNSAYLM